MRFSALLGLAVATLVASFAPANAQHQGVQVGVLECEGGQNVGFIVGSSTELECVFHAEGRPPEPYIAVVHRYGLDLGVTEQTGLAWAVNAPTREIGPGDLAGHFGGVGASATVGVGVGANLLVGGSANAYSLQPLSLQGQTGLSAVAGIVDVELHPGALAVPHHGYRRHHRRGHHRHHR